MINIDPRDLPTTGLNRSLASAIFNLWSCAGRIREGCDTGVTLLYKMAGYNGQEQWSPALLLEIYLSGEFTLLVQIINPLN